MMIATSTYSHLIAHSSATTMTWPRWLHDRTTIIIGTSDRIAHVYCRSLATHPRPVQRIHSFLPPPHTHTQHSGGTCLSKLSHQHSFNIAFNLFCVLIIARSHAANAANAAAGGGRRSISVSRASHHLPSSPHVFLLPHQLNKTIELTTNIKIEADTRKYSKFADST